MMSEGFLSMRVDRIWKTDDLMHIFSSSILLSLYLEDELKYIHICVCDTV